MVAEPLTHFPQIDEFGKIAATQAQCLLELGFVAMIPAQDAAQMHSL